MKRQLRNVAGAVAVSMIVALSWGCQAMTGKTAGRNVDDAAITASVKSTLAADRAATLTRVDVDTNNGVVSLNGVVETAEQKTRAEQLARRVDGVKRVINNLQVQKQS
ncbi:MAG TPA: BON domain-containing protein [Candidatus Eisenbacteria bacterium]|nr:BON domain-containing protein [Candidatus Eisenbacteria bacterium]